jgi:hypothetical protein
VAERYPDLVKPIVLPHRSHLGRDVLGIEIATDPYNIRDGKPIFLNGRSLRVDSVHGERAARGRQRADDRPYRMGQPGRVTGISTWSTRPAKW